MNFPTRTNPMRRLFTNRRTILGVTPSRSAAASIVSGGLTAPAAVVRVSRRPSAGDTCAVR